MMENAQVVQAAPTYSSLAIFSLVFTVLAWTVLPVMGLALSGLNLYIMFAMPLSGSVIASPSAWIAQRQIRRSGGSIRGEGLTKAASIMAYAQYTLFGLLVAFFFLQMRH
ncbi:hypothetical protein [Dyella japonica]|uniref:Uncharacterized protein n=1 Tax=Dyella japonica DSM 16301 TaxID=1440762 RepID=A0A0G9H7T2_9GAMM|nr:hypothetical protein [Dyella japonica]KLD65865.1 hypothetical protein Y882_01445 [Dyella japonica DSM 16301]